MGGDRDTRNATRIIATWGTNQNAAMISNQNELFEPKDPVGEAWFASNIGFEADIKALRCSVGKCWGASRPWQRLLRLLLLLQ